MGHRERYNRVGSVSIWSAVREDVNSPYFTKEEMIKKYFGDKFKGLDFKFQFEYTSTETEGRIGTGSVSILGLNAETIRTLCSYANPYEKLKDCKFITVNAGYENESTVDGKHELFTMPYIGATTTMPPEMWVNFTIKDFNRAVLSNLVVNNSTFISTQSRDYAIGHGMTAKEACQSICDSLGLKLVWVVKSDEEKLMPRIRGLDYSGRTASDAVRLVNSWGFLKAWAHMETSGEDKGTYLLIVNFKRHTGGQAFIENEINKPFEIHEGNGMIGLPKYTPEGELIVKTLLRKDIQIGDTIQVNSKYVNSYYKNYKVNKILYEGHFRGQEWYTTYTAIANDDRQRSGEAEQPKKYAEKSASEKKDIQRALDDARAEAARTGAVLG